MQMSNARCNMHFLSWLLRNIAQRQAINKSVFLCKIDNYVDLKYWAQVPKTAQKRMEVLAMNAGMDSGIIAPTNQDLLGMIYATEAILGKDEYCMEYIAAYREKLFGQKNNNSV